MGPIGAEKDRLHARGKIRIRDHFLQVVNEVGEVQCADAGQLVGTSALEEHGICRQCKPITGEESTLLHPPARGVPQIYAFRVMMAELGFVTDDYDCSTLIRTTAQKSIDSIKHGRGTDALTVDIAF